MSAEGVNLVEIFSSLQGEGPQVGSSTLFVRLGECDLRCLWCDSVHTWKRAERCRIEREPAARVFDEIPNPVAIERAVEICERLGGAARHRFTSLTGGEPLLQPEACKALAEALKARGHAVHLETHGLHAAALRQVLHALSVVSMDWKFASDVRRAVKSPSADSFAGEHRAFLAAATALADGPELVVKGVVTPATRDAELDEMAEAVATLAPDACVVIQPVTPCGAVAERPSPERIHACYARVAARVADVRVIPQTHPIYGAL